MGCPVLGAKIIRFIGKPSQSIIRVVSPVEGRFANVTNVGGDAVDAECAKTCVRKADGEVVWACRPDVGGK